MAILSELAGSRAPMNPLTAGMFTPEEGLPQTRPLKGGLPVPITDPALLARIGGLPSLAPIQSAQLSPTQGDAPMASATPLSAPAQKPKGPGFFHHGGTGEKILSFLGEFANQYSASQGNPAAIAFLQNRYQSERMKQQAALQQQQQDALWAREDARDARKAALPIFRNVGNELVQFDPTTGQTTQLYQGRSPAEEYATAMGLDPDTDKYMGAMQDYVLRGNGPTAAGFDSDLETQRQGNRMTLEGVRQGNRLSLRQTPTYTQAHPRQRAPRHLTPNAVMGDLLSRYASGNNLNANERALVDRWNAGGRGRSTPTLPGGPVFQPRPSAPAPKQSTGGIITVRTPQEAMALPKGTRFRSPDGQVRVRP